MNIYLDIDGVLLTRDMKLANYASEFLKFVLAAYPDRVYWLTTRCKGDATQAMQYISPLIDESLQESLKSIKATDWDMAKTRAIDFSEPFLWFDDNLFAEERQTLIDKGVYENLIMVDLKKYPDQLRYFIDSFPVPINESFTSNIPTKDEYVK